MSEQPAERQDLIALANEMRAEVARIGKNYDVWAVPSVGSGSV